MNAHHKPQVTETDVSAGRDPACIREAIEKSRRDVLDLSLRNPLLNFRPSKRRGLEVVDELSRELRHIANAAMRSGIERMCRRDGYDPPSSALPTN